MAKTNSAFQEHVAEWKREIEHVKDVGEKTWRLVVALVVAMGLIILGVPLSAAVWWLLQR